MATTANLRIRYGLDKRLSPVLFCIEEIKLTEGMASKIHIPLAMYDKQLGGFKVIRNNHHMRKKINRGMKDLGLISINGIYYLKDKL